MTTTTRFRDVPWEEIAAVCPVGRWDIWKQAWPFVRGTKVLIRCVPLSPEQLADFGSDDCGGPFWQTNRAGRSATGNLQGTLACCAHLLQID